MGEMRSDFLFARATFLEGVARILDLGDTLTEFNTSLSVEQADQIAASADVRIVGQELRRAAETATATFEREQLQLDI